MTLIMWLYPVLYLSFMFAIDFIGAKWLDTPITNRSIAFTLLSVIPLWALFILIKPFLLFMIGCVVICFATSSMVKKVFVPMKAIWPKPIPRKEGDKIKGPCGICLNANSDMTFKIRELKVPEEDGGNVPDVLQIVCDKCDSTMGLPESELKRVGKLLGWDKPEEETTKAQ